jgi:hypothetical protein
VSIPAIDSVEIEVLIKAAALLMETPSTPLRAAFIERAPDKEPTKFMMV